MTEDVGYIPLHVHTEYSIYDSIVRIPKLCQKAKAYGIPAVAITDLCNLFALVKFYNQMVKAGIKPIMGCELWLTGESQPDPVRIVVLCQNQTGFNNLCKLLSKAYYEGERKQIPIIPKTWIFEHNEGLIVLSGASQGVVGQFCNAHNVEQADVTLREWMSIFRDRFYIELQRIGKPQDDLFNQFALKLALSHDCPIVATNPTVFLEEADYEAHEARVCIQEGWTLNQSDRPRRYTKAQYFKSPTEMHALFSDLPQALANTVEIAKRCNVQLSLGNAYLPNFPVPKTFSVENYLVKAAKEGLDKRLQQIYEDTGATREQREMMKSQYQKRLEMELEVINAIGFTGYFLIVSDFIRWAKEQKIPVGPGRGSGAGSLVAYSLEITGLDPIEYDLLFERFLNPERVSMPDFDVDFCMEHRDRVIEYVADKYGRESVSQIATFGTMAAKAVVRDTGRVLGLPYGFVDIIAKLVPFEIGMTLEKALEQEETLKTRYETDEEVTTLIDLAMKLEGIIRNVGKHAGGVVIAPSKLTDFLPLYCEGGSQQMVSQLDKDDVEKIGLVKFDFLGLRTLTIIDWAVQNANAFRSKENLPPIDINRIPLRDKKTFHLLKSCKTTAVFQLESRGMKDLIHRLRPDEFEEIIALVALFRPGPLQSGMVDDFINRKHGRAKVEYPHPALQKILKSTYGVILYQEQVMQIAQVLAGYTLGGADLLRRAMGKKKAEDMAKQRVIFTKGAVERGVTEQLATAIFELMEKFAGYGFNKSHSAAYAMVAYQTAWLKAHYPACFMAAVLSSDMDHTDKLVNYIEDCRKFEITVNPPNVNISHYKFRVEGDAIRYGLGAIKGIGEGAIENIINERNSRGAFKDLFDFCNRVDLRKINKRVLEALIKAGAMDCFDKDRAIMLATLPKAVARAEKTLRDKRVGQLDLFAKELNPQDAIHYEEISPWREMERLSGEKETLGLYLSGHPFNTLVNELNNIITTSITDISLHKDKSVRIAGLITNIRSLQTKRGERMAFVTLDDCTGRIEIAVFSDLYQSSRHLLIKDALLIVSGTTSLDEYSGGIRLRAEKLYDLQIARKQFVKALIINLKITDDNDYHEKIKGLQTLLQSSNRGNCPVWVKCHIPSMEALLKMPEKWNIDVTGGILEALEKQLGPVPYELRYQ